jgi:transcription factor C subunit 6
VILVIYTLPTMPFLRERSKRPSYALLADPLEGLLSDEDRDSDASHAEGSQAGAKRRAKSESSASTDFGAANTSGSKGKGKEKAGKKEKGKGKAKASAFDDSGSEFEGPSSGEEEDDDMEDDVVDEVEEEAKEDDQGMEGLEDDKEDDLVDINSPPRKVPPPRRIPTAFTNAPSHSNQAAYVQSDTNLIPLRYRELVVKHSEIIAAPFRGKPSATPKERDYRARTLDPVVLPHGPRTPFVTRLKKEVKGREMAEVIYDQRLGHDTNEVEEKLRRQRNASLVVKSVTLAAPWQVWQGEGWWPEMAPGHPATAHRGAADRTEQAQQKGVPRTAKGWTPRDAVRLGLEHVGQYRIEQMRLLSKE